ncbi:Rhodanese-like protein [Hygrophoropsis aurantiaca]|uniref:Rhodanese-like protein n=1 Tax=Hygrophoropsis aurantiaca TaxID=72124 RepID=A0ACB8ACU5_9AGAM|nr:Rhodanese-like protein [Hygrophoropsis aurantiaca]
MFIALLARSRNGVHSIKKSSKLFLNPTRTMSSSVSPPLLLSPSQLRGLLPSDNAKSGTLRILDATWFMPNSPRNPHEEFIQKRISGANFLDLDKVASPHELGLKHMMPTEEAFAQACERFGIEPSSHVVIYDSHGVFSSPRALFMFRAFGHHNSSILDGGLPRWEAEGFPVATEPPVQANHSSYPTPILDKGAIRSYEQVVSNSFPDPLADPAVELVVDARSQGRYIGTDPEPRPGMSSGHIPHSFSLPFNKFLKSHTAPTQYTTFLPVPELLKALIDAIGADQAELVIQGKRSITASCGSGMTAGVLWLGLKLLAAPKIAIYDESWTGYASRSSSKIIKPAN